MKKDIKEYSFAFLKVFYDDMVALGVNYKVHSRDIDDKFVEDLNSQIKESLLLADCQKLSDICLANEWVKHTVMGRKYNQLRLTTTGVGVVKSKQRQIESHANRSVLKKVSDYVNDHSGIFVLLSFVVSLFSLFVAVAAIIVSIKGN